MNTYNFTDEKVLSGSNYYRLKQIEMDGKFSYSSVIELNYSKFGWSVSGNPLSNNSWKELQLDKIAHISFQIISMNGSVIQTINKGDISAGTYTIPLNLNNAAHGIYVVRLMVNNQVYSKKVTN